jgi:DNA-nicking Smr family endonuclease
MGIMTKPSGAGHRPFRILRELVDRGELELAPPTDKTIAPPRRVESSLSDEEAFARGMEEVRRLGWSDTPLSLPVSPVESLHVELAETTERAKRVDDETEALVALAEFVAGRGEMDPFATGEGVEGASSREGRRFLSRLKRGDFSVQGHLDLHGLGRDDVRGALERFLRDAQHKGYSCVRVVHGRGTHSESDPALMKREVIRLLSSRRLSRTVVAFASARWRDGGSGAVYVLLYRRWDPPRR